jgi:hypothetical protein
MNGSENTFAGGFKHYFVPQNNAGKVQEFRGFLKVMGE